MQRIFVCAALLAAFVFSTFAIMPVQAQQNGAAVTSQGNPYLVDFVSRQGKRSDLRANVTRKGLNAAFSEWLSVEHPDAYKTAVKQSASHSSSSSVKVATHAKRASGGCCVMASGCCSMCPTCCEQKSCAKGCCNLSACTMRPNCCN